MKDEAKLSFNIRVFKFGIFVLTVNKMKVIKKAILDLKSK